MHNTEAGGEVDPILDKAVENTLRGILPMLNVSVETMSGYYDIPIEEVREHLLRRIAERLVGSSVNKQEVELTPEGVDEGWLTPGEAAAIAGVSSNTITRWAKTGKFEGGALRTLGGHHRVRKSDLHKLLKRNP